MYTVLVTSICVSVSVCVSVCRRLHGPGCNLENGRGMPSSCALLGGFTICARVGFVAVTTYAEREMSASACTRSMPGSDCLAEQDPHKFRAPTFQQHLQDTHIEGHR